MSIYAAENGARFLPAAIPANNEFRDAVAALKEVLELTEIHLTGGEPTLHPAVAEAHHITAGVSGFRTAYRLPEGRRIYFKQIRSTRLPETCAQCRYNNDTDCQEGFYGVRLYYDRGGQYHVGVCIQRMDLCLPLDEFLTSPLCKEVMELRKSEYGQLIDETNWQEA